MLTAIFLGDPSVNAGTQMVKADTQLELNKEVERISTKLGVNPANWYGSGYQNPSTIPVDSQNNWARNIFNVQGQSTQSTQSTPSTHQSTPSGGRNAIGASYDNYIELWKRIMGSTPTDAFLQVMYQNNLDSGDIETYKKSLTSIFKESGKNVTPEDFNKYFIDVIDKNKGDAILYKNYLSEVIQKEAQMKGSEVPGTATKYKAKYLGDVNHPDWLALGDTKEEIEQRAIQSGINPVNLQWETYEDQPSTLPAATNTPTTTPTSVNTLKAYDQSGNVVYVEPGKYYPGISLTKPTTTEENLPSVDLNLNANTSETEQDKINKAVEEANAAAQLIFDSLQDKNSDLSTRKSSEILEQITKLLTESLSNTGSTSKPASLLDLYNEQKAALGIDSLETDLNKIDAEIQMVQTNLITEAEKAGEKLISTTQIGREKSVLQARAEREIALKQVERNAVAQQINNKINTLSTIMTLTQQDYSNATNYYNAQLEKTVTLYNLLKGEETTERTLTQQAKDDAKANLTIIQNALLNGKMDYLSLTADQRTQIAQLELQAGYPMGITAQLYSGQSKGDEVLATSSRTNESGQVYYDVLVRKADGSLTVEDIYRGTTEQEETSYPTSYKEWQLAGSPGTYENWVKSKSSGTSASSKEVFSFSSDQKSKLLNAGFSTTNIVELQNLINSGYTVDEIITGSEMSAEAEKVLKNVMSGKTESQLSKEGELANRFITIDYLRDTLIADEKLLKKLAEDAGYKTGGTGFLNIRKNYATKEDIEKYLNSIMTSIQVDRDSGHTDKEILANLNEQLQKKKKDLQ